MAYLNLNILEPVNFGGVECTPKVNTEIKMRLSQIKKYDANSLEILAEAFPDNTEHVRGFLTKLTGMDIQRLHAYLIGGDEAVRLIDKGIENILTKAFENFNQEEGEDEDE